MKSLTRFVPAALSLYIAFVFVQSLFFKFADSPETQHIFGTLDAWAASAFGVSNLFVAPGQINAYVIGTAELIAAVLLLAGLRAGWRTLNAAGALLALGIISGAIFFHLFTPLGVVVQGDGGLLFGMAVGVWLAAASLLWMQRDEIAARLRRTDDGQTTEATSAEPTV